MSRILSSTSRQSSCQKREQCNSEVKNNVIDSK